MTTFRRAHSPQQRETRRRGILDTAAAMLAEMPVSAVTLNELSRRAGMAKSNVLRYFESREAVLLELLTSELGGWADDLEETLDAAVDAGTVSVRSRQLVDVLVSTLAERPVLCDLMSEQAAVLDHNISPTATLEYKQRSIAVIDRLTALVGKHLPELGPQQSQQFITVAALLVTAVWPTANPPAALRDIYRDHPEIACHRVEFADTLRSALYVFMAGLLA